MNELQRIGLVILGGLGWWMLGLFLFYSKSSKKEIDETFETTANGSCIITLIIMFAIYLILPR